MASFRETREMLCISHAMDFITDAKFLLLYEESKSDNLNFPYQEYPTFSLPDKSRADCTANFRVEKHHITRLEDACIHEYKFRPEVSTEIAQCYFFHSALF